MFILTREEQRSLLERAYRIASRSNDPSTQNGAVIVAFDDSMYKPPCFIAQGYSRYPGGHQATSLGIGSGAVRTAHAVHAERHAIESARHARKRADLKDMILVCPWMCCTECAHDIITARIPHILVHQNALDRTPRDSEWYEELVTAHAILRKNNVLIMSYRGTIYDKAIGGTTIRHTGSTWLP
jgi:deoxycytidylate deaminase